MTSTAEQLPLFWGDTGERLSDIDRRFFEFHNANPEIFRLVRRFAREARDAGHKHYGIKGIFERIRWHVSIETRDPEGFKINNDFSSRYARFLMIEHPEFKGFFFTRELKTRTKLQEVTA